MLVLSLQCRGATKSLLVSIGWAREHHISTIQKQKQEDERYTRRARAREVEWIVVCTLFLLRRWR